MGEFMTKRSSIQERRRQRKRQQRLTLVLVVSGVALIIAALLALPSLRQATTPVGEIIHPELIDRPLTSGNAMGNPDAPVVIHEYSDFGCPHCADFAEGSGKQLAESYVASGQVYFVSHSVGSLLGSATSVKLAEAAYCAGDQNKYWEYHDYIFANQMALYSNPNAPVDSYIMLFAEALDLDMDAFEKCVRKNTFSDQVQQDQVEALRAGINSTPSFLINGQLLVGNAPFADFQAAIEAELSK